MLVLKTERKLKVKKIKINGNFLFHENVIKKIIATKETSYISWMKKTNIFSENTLRNDLSKIKRFYLKNGYLSFKVKSCFIFLSKDTKKVYININIHEGKIFSIGKILLKTHVPDKINEIHIKKFLMLLQSHIIFSIKNVILTKKSILNYFKYLSFNNINVRIKNNISYNKKEINLIYNVIIDKSINIRYINIIGNDYSSDEIFRRILSINPLGKLKIDDIKKTYVYFFNSGYVKDVNSYMSNVNDKNNRYIDVNYHLLEDNNNSCN